MTNRSIAIAVALVAGGLTASAARADSASELEALKARIAQLEASQNQAIVAAQAAADTDAALAKVIADADRRSMLMADGFAAGYDKGFKLGSSDGAYSLNINGQFQFRYVLNNYDGIFEDDADLDDGFEIRRMKVGLKGNVISKDLTYNFRWAFDRNAREGDSQVSLEDANVQYMLDENFGFKVGQWKGNVFHEESTSSSKQLAADRSLVNETLGGGVTDFVQGVSFLYKADQFRAEVAYTDGAASSNTNYLWGGATGGNSPESPDYGIEARVEFLAMGDWKAYEDFTAMKSEENLLVIGGGIDWSANGEDSAFLHTVDVQFETPEDTGLGFYAAYLGSISDVSGDDFYDIGLLAQVGYLIPGTQWEIFGRYGLLLLDDENPLIGDEDTFNEITGGVNYYFKGHDAKATVDITFLPDGSPDSHSGLGIKSGEDEQLIIRGQFQLLI